MWVNKDDPRVLFLDKRSDSELALDKHNYDVQRGRLAVQGWNPKNPTVQGDFRCLNLPDGCMKAVNWDPPQRLKAGENSLFKKKYTYLNKETWREDLKLGAMEVFRVLEPGGFLFFKWSDADIPLKMVLELFPHKPLFKNMTCGNGQTRSGSHHTFWCVFMKPSEVSA